MRAIERRSYGGPERLEVVTTNAPVAGAGQVVVRQQASSVNPLDWHELRGKPYLVRLARGLRRPREQRMGSDISGVVESVGQGVTGLVPGDEVFGFGRGAWAERVVVSAEGVVRRPASLDALDAGGVGVAGITALQALERAEVGAGQRVLIVGASGGVGTFAVQLAKLLGAHVTAVTSTPNLSLVARLGADDLVDYTTDDVTNGIPRFDVVLDVVGRRSPRELRSVLTPTGTLVRCGEPHGQWIGPLLVFAGAALSSRLTPRRTIALLAERDRADLQRLADWLATTALRVVVDGVHDLDDVAVAVARSESRRARGKILLAIDAA